MGDSCGAHLAALTALAYDPAPFANASTSDPYASINLRVKAVVGAYCFARPRDQIVEKFLGKPPMEDRKLYFESSPISYATRPNNQTSFFLAWGTADDIADPATQSEAFMLALKQAGFFVRPATTAAAPHFWMADPIDEPRGHVGVGFVAPRIARFLTDRL
jgi:acetyl esterase/lipase